MFLTLGGCAMTEQTTQPANSSLNVCVGTTNSSVESIPSDQQAVRISRKESAYHSDSEEYRIDHLVSRRYGSSNITVHTYNADRFDFTQNNRPVNGLLSPKPYNPWSRLQLILNDRWLLDADFDYTVSMASENSPAFRPTPRLRYEYGTLKLTTRYIPHIQNYNTSAVMAIYLSIAF